MDGLYVVVLQETLKGIEENPMLPILTNPKLTCAAALFFAAAHPRMFSLFWRKSSRATKMISALVVLILTLIYWMLVNLMEV